MFINTCDIMHNSSPLISFTTLCGGEIGGVCRGSGKEGVWRGVGREWEGGCVEGGV